MKTPFPHFLARLAGQPLLVRSDYLDNLSFAALRTPRADAGDGEGSPAPDWTPPWVAREQVTIYPGGIAVIPVSGMLAKGFDALLAWCYDFWRVEAVEAALALCAASPEIKTVVIDFNCPGGYTTGIPELGAQVAALARSKTVFAFTGTMCASAAYWLASQCSKIVCTPSSTIGSVGTYCVYYDFSGYLAQEGIKTELYRAGAMKGLHVMGHVRSDEEKAFIQTSVDEINAGFLAAVKAGRGALADADLQGQWFRGEVGVAKNFADGTVLNFGELLANLSASLPQTVLA